MLPPYCISRASGFVRKINALDEVCQRSPAELKINKNAVVQHCIAECLQIFPKAQTRNCTFDLSDGDFDVIRTSIILNK
jgi:hypothetical protein